MSRRTSHAVLLVQQVGKVLQKQMAELLTMQGGSEEKQMGFHASEKQRLQKAWAWSLLFEKNSFKEKIIADIYMYMMLTLNVVVVCLIVLKQTEYPAGSFCSDQTSETQDDCSEKGAAWNKPNSAEQLSLLLIVLPLISGVLLTFNNAFNPIQKYNALRWASAAMVSEIYCYRARAKEYGGNSASSSWAVTEDLVNEEDESQKLASKKFVNNLQIISTQVRSETQLQVSSLSYAAPEKENTAIAKKISTLFHDTAVPSSDELDVTYELHDRGFEQLSAEEYLQCRTKVHLKVMQKRLPPLSRRKEMLQALTYIATAASVMLGTIEKDLYIAITTGTVSFLTSIIEHQKLEVGVQLSIHESMDVGVLWKGAFVSFECDPCAALHAG